VLEAIRLGAGGSKGDRERSVSIRPGEIERALAALGGRVLVPADGEYPPWLRVIDDPPVALFALGHPYPTDRRSIAIVGSRRATSLGAEVARELGRRLGAAGLVVVSGAAAGIDGASHRGALLGGGRTVAVLGSGLDVVFPSSSRGLLERIRASGTLLSEYPPGTGARPHHFPARNRIVVGAAEAVVVVEGAAKSGSRISVDHALEMGREVFAVPGPVNAPLAQTPLSLLREGARLIRGADDLFEDLGIDPGIPAEPPPALEGPERVVWEALEAPMLPELLAAQVRMTPTEVVGVLLELELRGLVRSDAGRYRRTLGAGASS
jgi:DNA processing protein